MSLPSHREPIDEPTLAQVCESPQSFGDLDIAALNLMCAVGLPGAEQLDVSRLLDWLDQAASKVELALRRHWYRFLDTPGTYNNSPGYFCCYFLLQVLQEDCGVRYNPARVRDPTFQDAKCFEPDFQDSRDLFIHGVIDGPGGTCASMPVLYVAVGRRLGYPLKLVETRGHLFFRWDDPTGERLGVPERFNIEGTGEGIGSFPDDYYRTWPDPWSELDVMGGYYLKSLSPAEELAHFLSTRGECLIDDGRIDEAMQAYRWASGLAGDPRYSYQFHRLVARLHRLLPEMEEMQARQRRQQFGRTPYGDDQRIPSHNACCKCLHCREARQAESRRNAPGHPRGCRCSMCWPVGHVLPT